MNVEQILLTGGIGSGKSVVARICRSKGYRVYDCDEEARRIMNSSEEIRRSLVELFGPECIDRESGIIDRGYISRCVFGEGKEMKLRKLNGIVHSHVMQDIREERRAKSGLLIVESAIPRSSGLDKESDCIWLVESREEERIKRIKERNGLSRREILSRMASQKEEFENMNCKHIRVIFNSSYDSLLEQIEELIEEK